MAHCHIIPVPAASKDGPTVLLEVKQTGSSPLDVRLVGCEGESESLFVVTLKQRNIEKLKRKFKGSNSEWEAILSHFLLQKQPEEENAKALDDVNMVYAMDGEAALQLIIRRDVKGIKMTLGEISLPKDENYVINPFEWAQTSAEAHALVVNELADLKSKIKDSQTTIDQLNKQLEDFLTAKRQMENEMLEKFKVLLNEKKRKIRDQERLLATAKVDKATAIAVRSIRDASKPRQAGPSRSSKRKAATKPVPVANEEEGDRMDVDPNNGDAETEEEEEEVLQEAEAATPDRTTDEETEDEGLDEEAKSSVPQSTRQSADRTATSAKDARASNNAQTRADPPPRRELPFGRPGTRSQPAKKQAPPPVAAEEDEDEETEDEEL